MIWLSQMATAFFLCTMREKVLTLSASMSHKQYRASISTTSKSQYLVSFTDTLLLDEIYSETSIFWSHAENFSSTINVITNITGTPVENVLVDTNLLVVGKQTFFSVTLV